MTNVGGNLTVRADSVRAEGDAIARSYGGGVVDVGAANADTTVTPTVNAYIDTGATIDVDGAVVVEALARAQPIGSLGDTFTPNQNTIDNDTIDVRAARSRQRRHGHLQPERQRRRSAPPTAARCRPLPREYSVIATGEDTLQLGATFDAQGADTGDLFAPDVGVDAARDRIRFSVPHRFETGDAVKYDADGTLISTGLNETGTLLRRASSTTSPSSSTPTATRRVGTGGFADQSFGAVAVDATTDTITIAGQRLRREPRAHLPRRACGRVPAAPASTSTCPATRRRDVDNDRIFIDDHGFATGDRVIYRNPANADAMGPHRRHRLLRHRRSTATTSSSRRRLDATDPDDADDDVDGHADRADARQERGRADRVRHLLVRESIGGLVDGADLLRAQRLRRHLPARGDPGRRGDRVARRCRTGSARTSSGAPGSS